LCKPSAARADAELDWMARPVVTRRLLTCAPPRFTLRRALPIEARPLPRQCPQSSRPGDWRTGRRVWQRVTRGSRFVIDTTGDRRDEGPLERTGRGSMAWRVNGERVSVLGWGRAILLQLAHPLVAAGVGSHSSFRSSPWSTAGRFRATLRAMLALTFGTDADARATVQRIRAVHDRVNGALPVGTPKHPVGTRYSAHDPSLLAWVNLTLLDSMPLAYTRLVAPLSDDQLGAYARESRWSAELIGVPRHDLPGSAVAVRADLERWLTSGELEVTEEARHLARAVVAPRGGWVAGPLADLHRRLSVGWLPAPLREAYGFRWDPGDARALERWESRLRWWSGHAPLAARRWRAARRRE
jgi:uncharacterized protein (DUF2236 family)